MSGQGTPCFALAGGQVASHSAEGTLLYLILDNVDAKTVARVVTPGTSEILEFGQDAGVAARVVERLAGAKVLDVRDVYRQVLPELRERFARFGAEWPERYRVGRRSFKTWLRRDGLSLWWLLELSQKNPESSRTFRVLCQAEVLRRQLLQRRYDLVVSVGGDPPLAEVFGRVCRQTGVPFSAQATTQRLKGTLRGRIVSRAWSGGAAMLRALFARRCRGRPEHGREGSPRVAFLTWCPAQWADWKGEPRDRYFVDVPDYLQKNNASVLYACSLWSVRAGDLRGAVERARLLAGRVPQQMVWIESLSSCWTVAKFYLSFWTWLQMEFRAFSDRNLALSLASGLGVDLSPVLVPDLLFSLAVNLPGYQLLAEQIRRFVSIYRPTHLVTILETYCYGRAVTWGTRLAGSGTKVVGLQHSPANRNQLFYRYMPIEVAGTDPLPLPDIFLLHGQLVETQLREAGVETTRLRVVGAPRFAPLLEFRRRRLEDRASLRREIGLGGTEDRIVLVAGVIWPDETARILRWAFEAVARLGEENVTLVIKPHPMNPHLSHLVVQLGQQYPRVRHLQTRERLNALQAVSDVMITGNSTSDVEAIVIGCPVIRLPTFDIGSSPTEDFPESVREVTSPADLAARLSLSHNQHTCRSIIDWALGPLDDQAVDRIKAVLFETAYVSQSIASPVAVLRATD